MKKTKPENQYRQGDENYLAIDDGFVSAADLRAFFRSIYGLPLRGRPHWVSWH